MVIVNSQNFCSIGASYCRRNCAKSKGSKGPSQDVGGCFTSVALKMGNFNKGLAYSNSPSINALQPDCLVSAPAVSAKWVRK